MPEAPDFDENQKNQYFWLADGKVSMRLILGGRVTYVNTRVRSALCQLRSRMLNVAPGGMT